MKSLIRVGAVLAAVAFCAPALACSDMWQQTTAQQTTEQQPAVAKAQPKQTKQTVKKTAKAQTKVAKTQGQKVAAK
jgi:cytochrome c-type biogenesis protein CcmH/NrfG